MLRKRILHSIDEAMQAIRFLEKPESIAFIEQVAEFISDCYRKDKKVLIVGNGGSLCDAMHFAEELTGQFRHKRPALSAIALSDPGHLTCVGNDMGFESIFSRGVEAHGKTGDVLVILSTSGNSPNLVAAVQTAKQLGLGTIAFLGKTGGKMKGLCDLEWVISGFPYSDRIQEVHMAAIHILIEVVEMHLFEYITHAAR